MGKNNTPTNEAKEVHSNYPVQQQPVEFAVGALSLSSLTHNQESVDRQSGVTLLNPEEGKARMEEQKRNSTAIE